MIVGVLRVRLHLPAARSLKDRRMVVRKAVDRVRARHGCSIAEVGDTSRWQVVTLGVAMVSEDGVVVQETLDRVVRTIASAVAGEAVLVGRDREQFTWDALGPGAVDAALEEKWSGGQADKDDDENDQDREADEA